MPRLIYQTAAASLIQFITLMLLGIPSTIVNIVSTCHGNNSNCVSNMIVSLILYILTAGWFGIIMILGYATQKRRSRQFAVLLMGFEFATLVVSGYFDFPRESSILNKTTSLIDAILSIWIIYIAFRLFLSGGKRMVKKPNIITRASRSLK